MKNASKLSVLATLMLVTAVSGFGSGVPQAQAAGAPAVHTDIANEITQTGAKLNGTVNPNGAVTTIYFEYGTSPSFGTVVNQRSIGEGGFTITVFGLAWDLRSATTYYYRLVAQNSYGTSYGETVQFTTAGSNTPGSSNVGSGGYYGGSGYYNNNYNGSGNYYGSNAYGSNTYGYYGSTGSPYGVPSVYTQPASSITQNTAVFVGGVNPSGTATDAYFEYGLSQSLGSVTASQVVNGASITVNVVSPVVNLQPGTAYYYRIVARNPYGSSYGSVLSFTTLVSSGAGYGSGAGQVLGTSTTGGNGLGTGQGLPGATTNAAFSVSERQATVSASVNPNGGSAVAWFEYGTSENLGESAGYQSVGSGSSPSNVSYAFTGLRSGATYYYRVAAQNGSGISRGSVASFRTLGGGAAASASGAAKLSLSSGVEKAEPIKPKVDIEHPAPGDLINYTLTYQNSGTAGAKDIVVTLVLPEGTKFVSAEPDESSVTAESVTWASGPVAAGTTDSVEARIEVGKSVKPGTKLAFVAILSYLDAQGKAQSVGARLTLEVSEPKKETALTAAVFGSITEASLIFWLLLALVAISGTHFFYHLTRAPAPSAALSGSRMDYAEIVATPGIRRNEPPAAAKSYSRPPPAIAAYQEEQRHGEKTPA